MREFLRRLFTNNGTITLVYHRGTYFEWDGKHFKARDEEYIGAKLYEFLLRAVTLRRNAYVPFDPTQHKVSSILHALKHGVLEDADKQPPFWRAPVKDVRADNLIACKNGLLNVETRELMAHSPLFFNTVCLPYDYNPKAEKYSPLWTKFLHQVWPEDEQARRTLQEIFGLMLTGDTSFQKIFMIVGPGRAGKGTIGRVLTALLGSSSVTNPTMASMTGEFGLWQLIDKLLAIISDARLSTRADANVVAERLLSISGEDGQSINRKNKPFWSGNLAVRFLILTNELPRITDASGVLVTRYIILKLTKSFLHKEDQLLTEKLKTELPNILNWALRGLERLRKRGYIKMPKSSLEEVEKLERLASPIRAFTNDWCEVELHQEIAVKKLYAAYRFWSEREGARPKEAAVFGRDLSAAFPTITRSGVGARRTYRGITLTDYGERQYSRDSSSVK